MFPHPPHLLCLHGWEAERWRHHEAIEVGSWIEGLETLQILILLLLLPAHHHLRLRAHRKMPEFTILVKRRKNGAGVDERNERVWTRQPGQWVTGRYNSLRRHFRRLVHAGEKQQAPSWNRSRLNKGKKKSSVCADRKGRSGWVKGMWSPLFSKNKMRVEVV